MTPHTAPSASPSEGRPLVITFWVMLAVALWSWSLSWNAPILDRHEFRQLQTAISAHWLREDGFRLNYETPLFGPPTWSIPMEFPTYQWCVAQLSNITGTSIETCGRATSIFFLLATLPALSGIAGLLGIARSGRLLILAAVLSSPVYLFYGRAVMIESTALCAATWFLLAIGRAARDLSLRWAELALVVGCLAALTKVTTFVVYGFPAAALLYWFARSEKTRGWWTPSTLRRVMLCGTPTAVAITVGAWWVQHADAVKDINPFSGFLKSAEMRAWNWGTLEQRFSLSVWQEMWSNISQFVLSEPAVVVLAICAAVAGRGARCLAAAGIAAFLMGPLLFTNLYYRHDYYYFANALLLLSAAGVLLVAMWNNPLLPKSARLVMLILFFGAQLLSFYRGYGYNHRRQLPDPPAVANTIREKTPPAGVILVYGWDWSSAIPYYAQRRAIMVPEGRETEFAVLEDIVKQLPPLQISAVLIKHGPNDRLPAEFIQNRIERFALTPQPISSGVDGDLYLVRSDASVSAAKTPAAVTSATEIKAQLLPPAISEDLRDENLADLDLSMLSPRPTRARSQFGLSVGAVDGKPVLLAHPLCELYFTAPLGARRIEAELGFNPEAYAPGASAITDGIEVEIIAVNPTGTQTILHTQGFDPAARPADRGFQKIALPLKSKVQQMLIFRITPGPKNNLTNDWAYWSKIKIQ